MQVAILGPVVVTVDGRRIEPDAPKERAVLVALALQTGRPVLPERLAAAIWGEDPPPTAAKTLQSHLSRLRSLLGEDVIVTEPGGYRLAVADEDVDATRLEHLVLAGLAAAEEGDPAAARGRLAEAEALWRGEPLTDLADTPDRLGQVTRLRELWWRARDGRIEADLALGRHDLLIGELELLVAQEPLREPLWGQLILALYRAGRQADALHAYRRLRDTLADQLGVEPSPSLQRLEWRILRQDPQLDLRAPPPPSRLPAPVSSFVGRRPDVDAVAAALRRHRLVTLHGPGGVGKTRLGLEAARRVAGSFPDGAWWVDVVQATDLDGVIARVAETLGVSPGAAATPLAALVEHVRRRELLLVLDNCEHVAGPVTEVVTAVLRGAPAARVLATSRVVLDVDGELRWAVAPLGLPEAGAGPEAEAAEAVALFQERRAQHVTDEPGDLGTVAALVRRLDGLPLAIELAAARTRHLTPAEILDRLEQRIAVLGAPAGGGIPAHHRTMRAAIDWSYDTLDPAASRMFERLSVFPGDFDLAAAEAVGASTVDRVEALDRLGALVDASMVVAAPAGDAERYRVLVVLREYGAERLAARGEAAEAQQAHADHYRAFAQAAGPGIDGPDAGRWWRRVLAEQHNVRAALAWSLDHDDRATTLEFARLLARSSEITAATDFRASVAVFERMLDGADDAPADRRGWAWHGLAMPAYLAGRADLALEASERARALFEEAGEAAGTAATLFQFGGTLLLAMGDTEQSAVLLRQAAGAAASAGLPHLEAFATAMLAQCILFSGTDPAAALPLMERSEALADPGLDVLQAHLAMNRGYHAFLVGDFDASARAGQEARERSRAGRSSIYEQVGSIGVGTVALARGALGEARRHLLQAAQLAVDTGNTLQLGIAVQGLARVVDAEGDAVRAARLWGAGTGWTPVYAFIRPTFFPAGAVEALGDRFDAEVGSGRGLTPEQALDVAIG